MAELDEALFSLENILDFKATIGYENAQDCLNLEIKWMGQDQTAAALDAVRSNIPLTQQIAIRVQSSDTLPVTMSKRVIVDQRTPTN
jgi:hypothetical protein